MEKKVTYRKIAFELSDFIVKNWHFCPLDENIMICDCDGWKSEKCKKCIRSNYNKLNN